MKLDFHPEAELELIDAAFRYDLEVPGLGERFGAEVRRVTDLLLEYPNIGREVGSGRRTFSLHRFPFTLIYAASPEILHVLAVAHDRRGPGYWRSHTKRAGLMMTILCCRKQLLRQPRYAAPNRGCNCSRRNCYGQDPSLNGPGVNRPRGLCRFLMGA